MLTLQQSVFSFLTVLLPFSHPPHRFDLSRCDLYRDPAPLPPAFSALCRRLHSFNLSDNDLSEGDTEALLLTLATVPQPPMTTPETVALPTPDSATLRQLSLSGNQLKTRGCLALAEALLTQLSITKSLSAPQFGRKKFSALARLVDLELDNCKISDQGACALATALSALSALPSIDGPHHQNHQSPTEQQLDSGNDFIAPHSDTLCTLNRVTLTNNYISNRSFQLLFEWVHRCTTITEIDLSGNQLDHSRIQRIQALCKRNVQAIRVSVNFIGKSPLTFNDSGC